MSSDLVDRDPLDRAPNEVSSPDDEFRALRVRFVLTSRVYVMQYAALQVLLPLRTHRFFRPFGVTEVLSQSGRRGGV